MTWLFLLTLKSINPIQPIQVMQRTMTTMTFVICDKMKHCDTQGLTAVVLMGQPDNTQYLHSKGHA